MKILYLIRTHQNPEQVYRLVRTIRRSNPSSLIVLSYSSEAPPLDLNPLNSIPGEPVHCRYASVRRCDMSLVQAYLEAIEWVEEQNIEFDWLVNLTGQCYPTQPLENLENLLKSTDYDGFLEYFELFGGNAPWPLRQCKDRYLYHYWRTGKRLSRWQLRAAKPVTVILNKLQNLIRFQWFSDDQFCLGRRVSAPFGQDLVGYGGSFFHVLSAECVKFFLNYLRTDKGRQLFEFYKYTYIPDESIFQTVLVNEGSFKFCNQNVHYISWNVPNDGRPGIVTPEHLAEIMTRDDIFFARKFSIEKDAEMISLLEERIFPIATPHKGIANDVRVG